MTPKAMTRKNSTETKRAFSNCVICGKPNAYFAGGNAAGKTHLCTGTKKADFTLKHKGFTFDGYCNGKDHLSLFGPGFGDSKGTREQLTMENGPCDCHDWWDPPLNMRERA